MSESPRKPCPMISNLADQLACERANGMPWVAIAEYAASYLKMVWKLEQKDNRAANDCVTNGIYRIEAVDGGYEAQMLYPVGAVEKLEWFPLRPDGYWSDPDAFSFGLISNRHVFATHSEAAVAVRKSMAINKPEQTP